MFFPKAWGLWVTLHGRENRDNLTRENGWLFKVIFPPIVEGAVWSYIESLLWGWCFSKCIAHIGSKDEEIFSSRHGVEQTGAGLVDAIGVDFIKDFNRSGTG